MASGNGADDLYLKVKGNKVLADTFNRLLPSPRTQLQLLIKRRLAKKILTSLASSTWGKGKETLMATYKAADRPVLNYTAKVCTKLQLVRVSYSGLQRDAF